MISKAIKCPPGRSPELPPWMRELCEATTSAMSGGRLKAIVEAQVRKAEAGNTTAAIFCLELFTQAQQVLAAANTVPATATEVSPKSVDLDGAEFDILCRLEDAGGCLNLDDLTEGIEQKEPTFVIEEVIKGLVERGLMTSRNSAGGPRFRISVAGSAALK